MTNPGQLPRDIGAFIRDLRRNAQISLRQLAQQAGVSNPYLSQIERGLRKPSAEVLSQIASALRVSTPVMYLRAGLLDALDGQGVLAAIAADPELTLVQKQSLTQIYETFRRENARAQAHEHPAGDATAAHGASAAGPTAAHGASAAGPTAAHGASAAGPTAAHGASAAGPTAAHGASAGGPVEPSGAHTDVKEEK